MAKLLLLPYLLFSLCVFAVEPTVHLNYATYKGTSLSNGITQWLGMRFAAPPVGKLRFSAPQDPLQEYGVQNADKVCSTIHVHSST